MAGTFLNQIVTQPFPIRLGAFGHSFRTEAVFVFLILFLFFFILFFGFFFFFFTL